MGRAIDMENDIGILKKQVEKLENTVRGMVSKLDELDDAVFDYEEETVKEEIKEKEDGKKKANNKGSSKSSGDSESGHGHSKDEDNKSGKSSS